ncbi:MAG TPA: hypothetical protein VKU84_02990 [Stellaceae bacterium]|nr:hypothetical protein [Stellaceae bacterium]
MLAAKDALDLSAKVMAEYRGALLINYILVQRAGGVVEISEIEMARAAGGRLRVARDPSRAVWLFQAVAPEQPSAIEDEPSAIAAEIVP